MCVFNRVFFLLSLTVSIISQGSVILQIEDIDSHLEHYTYNDDSHHDNIADSEHSHTHKHNKDDEEHEHHHDHNATPQVNLKLLSVKSLVIINLSIIEESHKFFRKILISSEYPSAIFRPPIV